MSEPAIPAAERADQAPRPGPHSRRAIALRVLAALLVAGVAVAVQQLWLAEDPSRETFGAAIRKKMIDSELLDRTLPVRVVTPKRAPAKGRSLLVFLHGRGDDERTYLVEPMFKALAKLRDRAPVVAFPRAGPSSYWHDRGNGPWASYVLEELIPTLVERFDVDPRRVAIGGISMGGFGAFDIARLDAERFCAVGGHSPVIWASAGETADGAFDDADDFARNDLIAIARMRPSPFAGPRLWLDAGSDDPFQEGDRTFVEALRASGLHPKVQTWPGGHDTDYWDSHWDDYLRFYARALNDCGETRGPGPADEPGNRAAPGPDPTGGPTRDRGPSKRTGR